jgi:effector-binding domain-containing protein
MTRHLPTIKRKKVIVGGVVESHPKTFNELKKKLTTEDDIDTAGVPDTVPDFDMTEKQKLVPDIGIDDRLFTELEVDGNEDDNLNKKIVPSDTAVSGRLYTI